MAILTGKQILKPYFKKASGYIKSLLSSQHVEMNDGRTLQTTIDTLNKNLTVSKWIYLGSVGGLQVHYKYNDFMCQIVVDGSLDGSTFVAWHSYQVGTLPEGCRPVDTPIIYSDMSGDTLLLEVKQNGYVGISSRASFSGSTTYWNTSTMFFTK